VRAKRVLVCPRSRLPIFPVDCLLCEDPCAPRHFLYSLMRVGDTVQEIEDYSDISVIGVTEITDCPRRAYWRRVEHLEEMTWDSLVRIQAGSAVHGLIQQVAKNALMWAELPIAVRINYRWVLIGVIDAYDPLEATLWEIKTTSFRNMEGIPFEEHVWQIRIYWWMLRQAGIHPRRLRIFYLLREAKRSAKQWVAFDVEPPGHPDVVYGLVTDFIDSLEEALKSNDPSVLPLPPENKRFKCEHCAWRRKCLPMRNGQQRLEVSIGENES